METNLIQQSRIWIITILSSILSQNWLFWEATCQPNVTLISNKHWFYSSKMASGKCRLQNAWPWSHSDPMMPWISEAYCLFTLHRWETIAVMLFHIASISTFDVVSGWLSMWIMAVAQSDLSRLEIFKDLRAQVLTPTFATIPAMSPLPCCDVPSGLTKLFSFIISSVVLLS